MIFYSGKNKDFNPKHVIKEYILERKFGKHINKYEAVDFFMDSNKPKVKE